MVLLTAIVTALHPATQGTNLLATTAIGAKRTLCPSLANNQTYYSAVNAGGNVSFLQIYSRLTNHYPPLRFSFMRQPALWRTVSRC